MLNLPAEGRFLGVDFARTGLPVGRPTFFGIASDEPDASPGATTTVSIIDFKAQRASRYLTR